MTKVVECVPNFSEGQNETIIQAIASSIRETDGCSLLDVDSGASTNRTVYTFFGSPSAVIQGALMAAKCARRLIDMSKHHGEHPRIGALDVCPFIPVTNVTMEECIECSRAFGQKLSEELDVPVYLYEESQEKVFRKTLSSIRKGEYEELQEKLQNPDWAPDFGPATFVPVWGTSVTGARKFLIAYNINLLGTKEQAHRIALDIRESGRGPTQRGLFQEVEGLGWYLEEKNLAQVSMNLCDYNVTSLHTVYEECHKIAKNLNLAVVGSEIVGMVPLAPILMAAEHYIEKEGLFIIQEEHKIRLVIERLGLSSISEFKPKERIIEYSIGSKQDGPFLSGSLRSFVEELGDRTSAPGGGSAAACISSMGAALGTMVGLLTFGKREFEALDSIMRATIKPLHTAMQQMLLMVDKDAEAFSDYMEALKLPKRSKDEKERRKAALQLGIEKAIEVPLSLMRLASSCWPHLAVVAEHGNIRAVSDIQVAAHCLDTGIRGAYYNVSINLKQVKDNEEYETRVKGEAEALLQDSSTNLSRVLEIAKNRK